MNEATTETKKVKGTLERARSVAEEIPTLACAASPTNPRKVFTKLEELATSLKDHGMLVPMIVRPKKGDPERFEIVDGERRWRAAKLAKLDLIPATVRDYDDAKVLELQLVAHAQREDIHPLEEADAFATLHEKFKLTHEEIAARVGKPLSTVVQRLKFASLIVPARGAFLAGKLNSTTALLVARLGPDVQADALKAITITMYDGAVMPTRQAAELIARDFTLTLAEAPFDIKDAALVPQAGSCLVCPKRSKNQSLLFVDEKIKDSCLDRACFKTKVLADFDAKKVSAKKRHLTVLEGKAAETAMTHGSGFVELDEKNYDDKKERTYRTLLGKKEVPVVLAKGRDGEAVELVRQSELVKAGVIKKASTSSRGSGDAKKEREKVKAEREKRLALIAGLVVAAKDVGTAAEEFELARAIARGVCRVVDSGTAREVMKRREIKIPKGYPDLRNELVKYSAGLTLGGLRGLVVELLVHEEASRKEFAKLLEVSR